MEEWREVRFWVGTWRKPVGGYKSKDKTTKKIHKIIYLGAGGKFFLSRTEITDGGKNCKMRASKCAARAWLLLKKEGGLESKGGRMGGSKEKVREGWYLMLEQDNTGML